MPKCKRQKSSHKASTTYNITTGQPTRFNELPRELISNIIDFIPLQGEREPKKKAFSFMYDFDDNLDVIDNNMDGHSTMSHFQLTCKTVADAFQKHPRYVFHHVKSSLSSALQYLHDSNQPDHCETELKLLRQLLDKSIDKLELVNKYKTWKLIWDDWVNGSRPQSARMKIQYPHNLKLSDQQKRDIYDKIYGRVRFESSTIKRGLTNHDTGNVAVKRTAEIRFPATETGSTTDIVLKYTGSKYHQDISDFINLKLTSEDLNFDICVMSHEGGYDPFDDAYCLECLDGLAAMFELQKPTNKNDYHDLVDVFLFAFPIDMSPL